MLHKCLLVCFVCKEAKFAQNNSALKRLQTVQTQYVVSMSDNYIIMVKWWETIPYKIEVRKIAIITVENI